MSAMTAYSCADERARTPPPEPCQHCTRMQVWRVGDVTRWHCGAEQQLQTPCAWFDPLPDGRRAEPAPVPPNPF